MTSLLSESEARAVIDNANQMIGVTERDNVRWWAETDGKLYYRGNYFEKSAARKFFVNIQRLIVQYGVQVVGSAINVAWGNINMEDYYMYYVDVEVEYSVAELILDTAKHQAEKWLNAILDEIHEWLEYSSGNEREEALKEYREERSRFTNLTKAIKEGVIDAPNYESVVALALPKNASVGQIRAMTEKLKSLSVEEMLTGSVANVGPSTGKRGSGKRYYKKYYTK